jgi:hypothetical protein
MKNQYIKLESITDGGEIRALRGITCENMVDMICKELNIESRVGSKDLQTITITGRDGIEYTTKHQVDRHLYHKEKMIAIVECKSYLDSCYYVRTCSDFKRMAILHPNIKKIVFALENSISDNSKAFTDIDFDYVCDDIFYMCKGKRSSSKPIYTSEFSKEICPEQFETFITFLRSLLD